MYFIFFKLVSIFVVVVENNSFNGYKIYARQQYKRSISNIQKSVNNLSSFINQSNSNKLERQKRSEIPSDDSQFFTLIYPFQPLVLALDVIFFFLFYKLYINYFFILPYFV